MDEPTAAADPLPRVVEHYERFDEAGRLTRGQGRLEGLRTRALLQRWLPPAPAVVVDVGGAAGAYALPLAEQGHEVHLLDPVPRHLRQAREASAAAASPLASVTAADARSLPLTDRCADAVLLLGPLYHLTARPDRLQALREARRVLRPGGLVVAAAISRWGSASDAVHRARLHDDFVAEEVLHDVATGEHRHVQHRRDWFTAAYLHRPEDLAAEVADAGFSVDGPVAVEGLAAWAPDLDAVLDDPVARERLLALLAATEREPSLLGAGSHLLVAGHLT
ncbi:MAG: class I SAM-dependent methyltransferase [Quadrisphaera sp.]